MFEEDPEPDNALDNTLFNISLDTVEERPLEKSCSKVFPGFHQTDFQETCPTSYSEGCRSLGEKELMSVETWNKILYNSKQERQHKLHQQLTDLEVSVCDGVQETLSLEEQNKTVGARIRPGESLTLNMSDLEEMALKCMYQPLPIYYFSHAKLTLITILNRGAATYTSQTEQLTCY